MVYQQERIGGGKNSEDEASEVGRDFNLVL